MGNLVGEVLHAISHCYHSMSDLIVEFHEPPPRALYTAIVPGTTTISTAVIQPVLVSEDNLLVSCVLSVCLVSLVVLFDLVLNKHILTILRVGHQPLLPQHE